jgi:heptosyltransferase-2
MQTPSFPERILVARTDRIGDVLLSTPVLSVLRAQYPGSRIAMLVTPYTRPVVEGHPALDAILTDDRQGVHRGVRGFFRLVRAVRRERFDAALVLHPTGRLALLCRLAGIPVRIGSGYRAYGFLFNRRVYEHRRDARRHEVDYNLRLVTALSGRTLSAAPHIDIPEEARQAVQARFSQWGIRPGDRVAVLHPGSGGSARIWPAASFAALGDRLAAEAGVRVILTGGPGEEALVQGVAARMQNPPFMAAGDMTLKELAALLSAAHLCVTNSTGPLHIAAAAGTPTVALFCPITPCSPKRWGPYGAGHRVFQPDVPACPRCIEEACPYFDCMTRIPVDAVNRAAQDMLCAIPAGAGRTR